jgi:hypothetical protein
VRGENSEQLKWGPTKDNVKVVAVAWIGKVRSDEDHPDGTTPHHNTTLSGHKSEEKKGGVISPRLDLFVVSPPPPIPRDPGGTSVTKVKARKALPGPQA